VGLEKVTKKIRIIPWYNLVANETEPRKLNPFCGASAVCGDEFTWRDANLPAKV
jgi:hypothetical protein